MEPYFSDVIFITDKNFPIFQENEKLKIWKYFDISNSRILSFIIEKDDLYICLQQQLFGSSFLGNLVFSRPKYIIVKKIDPLIILIGLFYSTNNDNKFIQIENIIHNYEEILNNFKKIKEIKEIIDESKIFINKIFSLSKNRLSLIVEEKKNINISETNNNYQLLESKVIKYLMNKTKLTEKEENEIEKNVKENEKEAYKERKLKKKCEIISGFLPQKIYNNLLINLNIKIEPKNFEEIEKKRKPNISNKRRTNEKKQLKNQEVAPNQKTINSFFKLQEKKDEIK